MLLGLVIYISFIFIFFKKRKIIDYNKASWPKIFNIIFLFLLKIGSVGPVDQQINLVPLEVNVLICKGILV